MILMSLWRTLKSICIYEIPIRYTNEINNLPNSIEELRIGVKSYAPNKYSWEDPIYAFGFDYNFEVEMFNIRISKFPSNLKKLYIYNKYEHVEELKEILGDKLIVV